MRSGKRLSRGDRAQQMSGEERERPGRDDDAAAADDADADAFRDITEADDFDDFDDGSYEIFRVHCPDCARPIALLADENVLPEHALCPTPWNPFGLTVCQGSGRPVTDAAPAEDARDGEEQDVAALLTLPEGLHWRMQPFSHVGGPGSRPVRPAWVPGARG